MAQVTQVRRGDSSTQQFSEESDYRREQAGEGDTATLEGVHLDAKGSGWQLTIIHDRNGRQSKQVEHFDSYREAWRYCEPDDGKSGEQGEEQPQPIKQPGRAPGY